jgi:hypothetical protein
MASDAIVARNHATVRDKDFEVLYLERAVASPPSADTTTLCRSPSETGYE